ncbi:hypothetical protein, partial [Pseudomonas syringae group genomosp. 7]|uniref:hypothetical protein n=1 Tax=Pseudomonas syringae group genomosp. 7 TaxID=251699 RepID=UPI00376FF4E2
MLWWVLCLVWGFVGWGFGGVWVWVWGVVRLFWLCCFGGWLLLWGCLAWECGVGWLGWFRSFLSFAASRLWQLGRLCCS